MKIRKYTPSDVKKLAIMTMTFILLVGNVVATEEWSKTFGGRGIDWAWSVQQTSDGGYILAGSLGLSKIWLIKMDTNGNEEWNKAFGEGSKAWSVQQTLDGGYILAGETEYPYYGTRDGILIKTDINGNEQWSKRFEVFKSVQQTSDGGYILAGSSYGSEIWLVKTDTNGNDQWSNTFGKRGETSEPLSVQQTFDGGYILAGETISHRGDILLIKTDTNGNEQWNKTFGGKDYDSAESVQQTSDGGYILTGITKSYGSGKEDILLIKTDINGNEQWSKTFGGGDDDNAWSIQQTSDGGYIITGGTTSYGAGGWDAWLIKVDTNGSEQWSRTFGGGDNDWTSSVQQTSDSGYILAGRTKSYGAGDYDAWIIKIGAKPPTLGASGFEDIYAIVGLLAGVYILGRKR